MCRVSGIEQQRAGEDNYHLESGSSNVFKSVLAENEETAVMRWACKIKGCF